MGPVLALQLDELQRAVKLLQVFSEDSQRFLQSLSEQLGERQPLGVGPGASGWLVNGGVNGDFFPLLTARRTFRQLENSPVRKLIAAPPREEPPPEGPGGARGRGPRSGQ